VAPLIQQLIQHSSLGSWAFANASVVIHAVTASVPTIINNGRGAMTAINRQRIEARYAIDAIPGKELG
jgi:ABC-type molybdate transport system permease subunit